MEFDFLAGAKLVVIEERQSGGETESPIAVIGIESAAEAAEGAGDARAGAAAESGTLDGELGIPARSEEHTSELQSR